MLIDILDSLLVAFKYPYRTVNFFSANDYYNPFFVVWAFIVIAYLLHLVVELVKGDFNG